ncbi:UTRA domain-containing protein [Sphingomonas canadensis]|uniref:UTRA domain-containing protein n=1 Tax=Sphingomonas canadensis TaxID=1219257 RepID=A0ABW3HAX7_9SPHN|nr:UTRA domain-containing protein [Sphingomonas canadensis]MCW3838437.1 UTRA domain-containing protein [Sphingomonas canadensis]
MSIEARIRGEIEARIRSGEWAPGMRIPFEHELVATYGCARATANKALSRLAREGLIERRRRAGSFVARPQIRSAVVGVPDIALLVERRGEHYRWEPMLRTIVQHTADPEVQHPGGPWLHMEGLHHASGAPFAWEERWIDLGTVPEAAAVPFAAEPPGSWLLANVPWTDARHRISAIAAPAAVARLLDRPAGAPCLQVERWTWRQGTPVTFVRQRFPGDRFNLVEDFAPAP